MSETHLHAYRVGELYCPDKTRWDEGADFNYRSAAYELRIFYHALTLREENDFRAGPLSFALYVQPRVLFLAYHLPGLGWSDASFEFFRVPEAQRAIPAEHAPPDLLNLLVTEAIDGILRVIRVVSFPKPLAKRLARAIAAQVALGYDPLLAKAEVQETLRRYPLPKYLAAAALSQAEGE